MHLLHAVGSLLTFHGALRLWAQTRVLALPLAHWLRADMAARLLVYPTLHRAFWLATLRLARGAIF
jgi:hypothetical protein